MNCVKCNGLLKRPPYRRMTENDPHGLRQFDCTECGSKFTEYHEGVELGGL